MDFDLLAGLCDCDRQAVLAVAFRRRYSRGMIIFHEGDLGDSFHIIAKGRVAIKVCTPEGDVATLNLLSSGEGFGEQALFSATNRRTASAVAVEQVETLQLGRAEFESLRLSHPSVERLLLEYLSAMVQRLSTQLVEALYLPADKRLLRRLVQLDVEYGGGEIGITQEDLASMAGTTRSTANRVLHLSAIEGLVGLSRGKIRVLDSDRLRHRAG